MGSMITSNCLTHRFNYILPFICQGKGGRSVKGGDEDIEGMDMEKHALCIEEMLCTLHADAAEKCCANIDALFYAVNNLLEIKHGIEASC